MITLVVYLIKTRALPQHKWLLVVANMSSVFCADSATRSTIRDLNRRDPRDLNRRDPLFGENFLLFVIIGEDPMCA